MSDTNNEIKLHALDYWQVIRNRYGVILLAFFLVFMTATIVTYLMPKEYLGRVTIEINKEAHGGLEQPSRNFEPYQTFMQTQFGIIESKENLNRVVKDLDLRLLWDVSSDQEAYSRLVRKLKTREKRGSDMVEIEVYDPSAELAARLANHVAESYKTRREQLDRDRTLKKIEELEQQAQSQDALMEKARQEMFRQMKLTGIVDPGMGVNRRARPDFVDGGGGDLVIGRKLRLEDMMREISKMRTTIATLTGLDGKSLIPAAVELGLKSPTLSERYKEYQSEVLSKRRLRDTGLGAEHPRIIETEGVIEVLEEMLVEAVGISKQTLATQMEIMELQFDSMTELKESAEEALVEEKMDGADYVAARDEYELRRDLLANLNGEIAMAIVGTGFSQNSIVIHGLAEPSHLPAKPNVNLQLAVGAVLGLIFGIGLAFFLEYLDTSVKTMEDVERYLQVPVLAVIPQDVGLLHQQGGASPDAEAYRILRTNIEFNRKSADANAITLVSGGAGEGKSTTLVNLAYICAQGGYTTLMIDGDLRRPKLHTFFDINNSVGLTNFLTSDLDLEDVILQTPIDNLFFMPSGILPADAAGILNSRRMSELITEVKARFDLVLVDSPPILGVSDASVLASEVDLTMIVIQHRKLPRSMLVRVKQAVENVGGNLLGVVLNNVDVRSDSQYQYYTSYYTYYSSSEAASGRRATIGAPPPHVERDEIYSAAEDF